MPVSRSFATSISDKIHVDTTPSALQDTDVTRIHKTINLAANVYTYILIRVVFEGSWNATAGNAIQCTASVKFNGVTQVSRTLRQTDPSVNAHVIHGLVDHKVAQQAATTITVEIGNGNVEVLARVLSVIIEGHY